MDRIGVMFHEIPDHLVKGIVAARNITLSELADGLVSGEYSLWIITKGYEVMAAYMSTIDDDIEDGGDGTGVHSAESPSVYRSIWLFALGGYGARGWLDACHRTMVNYAIENGASSICMAGRPGWQRLLPAEFRVIGTMEDHYVYARRVA